MELLKKFTFSSFVELNKMILEKMNFIKEVFSYKKVDSNSIKTSVL